MTGPRVRRMLFATGLVLASAGSARAQSASSGASSGTIVGFVTTKDGGLPLGYSVVSIASPQRERFTDDRGTFTLADLPAGSIQLRVRHLGYAPADVPVTVHAGATDTVRIQLTHIVVRLSTVQVQGYPECKHPGAPSIVEDSAFATVFDQLKQNAEQYRLLTSTYPFNFAVERMMATALADGEMRTERVDTLAMRSVDQWKYAPGAVVTPENSRFRGTGALVLNLPTLVSFADETFIANHCFHNGGLETVDGTDLLRIDFVAASRLRDPDVDGSMFLDPTNFQIRRAFLHLTKIPREVRGLSAVEVTTLFGELFPSVPLIAAVSSINRFTVDKRDTQGPQQAIEEQRLIAVNFLKSRPGGEARRDEAKKPEQKPVQKPEQKPEQ